MLNAIGASVFGLAVMTATLAHAGEARPFTQQAFSESQAQGKHIVIDVYASWCPTCRKQQPVLTALQKDPAFKDLVVYQLKFDSQKAELRSLGAQKQSTLIVFRGKKETARSVGDTNPASIRALISTPAQ
ncbi:thioredoxin family protein [Asticcacaulis sp. AC402]|uniref:TlpA family protein disulfide reductase n=1 Tax=Asticcacaulis sp. AC402 TaxID=1282361 RepID=UPI0003C3DCF8|nr:thioredoxin family protein [Asticcacaulis sp. AC402]ESQ74737.1 hypothetical protein ABAC402_12590 [Asticcacaulis sp. AC402]